MRRFSALVLGMLLLLGSAPSHAQTWERKCVRGLTGMTLGVLEVPGNMTAETAARGPAEGLPLGFAKGLGMIVVRELVGTYEFVTTPWDAPEAFHPLLEPEFPWGYFVDAATSRHGGDEPGPS